MALTDATFAALATLKPGQPDTMLIDILGEDWIALNPSDKGYYFMRAYGPDGGNPITPFVARIGDDGRIGSLSFYQSFIQPIAAVGVALGTPDTEVFRRFPDRQRDEDESSAKYGIEAWRCDLGEGLSAVLKIREGHLLAVTVERAGVTYPGALPPEAAMVRPDLRAYDLEMLPRFVDPSNNHGWVFGLPPGITLAQWPLDPNSGYPLMHGFTVLLPEDYRIHGPEIVALSFFATAADQNDGGASRRDDLFAAVTGAPSDGDENPDLAPFRAHAAHAHPRLFRMTDILDYCYAVILLTEAEFRGAPCQPPQFGPNAYLDPEGRPKWLDQGSGYSYFHGNGGMGLGDLPVTETYSYKVLGAVPEKRLDWHRAIACTRRAVDPNAGTPPMEVYSEKSPQGYESPYDPEAGYNLKPWAEAHKRDHIGGTMRPTQGTPEFSPFYIEFEEYFGDYNFGAGGNAQLDFLLMKFDWACG